MEVLTFPAENNSRKVEDSVDRAYNLSAKVKEEQRIFPLCILKELEDNKTGHHLDVLKI